MPRRLEPDDPLRKTMLEMPSRRQDSIGPPPLRAADDHELLVASMKPELPVAEEVADVQPYRPIHRPPMAVLHILDDGRNTAEIVRIRTASCIIGRTEGDVKIIHDPQISTKHAEITRTVHDGKCRWCLRDLGSTNGTFARVKGAVLKDQAELMTGRHRFRFVAASSTAGNEASQADQEKPLIVSDIRQTCCWQVAESASVPAGQPHLVELLANGEGRRFPLRGDSEWIGREGRQCSLAFPDDMTLDSPHARLYRDKDDRWHIEDHNSANGVWIRVTEIPLVSQGSFILGEQVFVIVFP